MKNKSLFTALLRGCSLQIQKAIIAKTVCWQSERVRPVVRLPCSAPCSSLLSGHSLSSPGSWSSPRAYKTTDTAIQWVIMFESLSPSASPDHAGMLDHHSWVDRRMHVGCGLLARVVCVLLLDLGAHFNCGHLDFTYALELVRQRPRFHLFVFVCKCVYVYFMCVRWISPRVSRPVFGNAISLCHVCFTHYGFILIAVISDC